MYGRVLVPTDGSDLMAEVIEHAVDFAGTYDADVHALYVTNTGAIGTLDVEDREHISELLEERGERAVETVADAGIDATTAIQRGTPHQRIVEYVETHDIDLVVMGTHGRTGLRHVLLGSVAENVIRQVPVFLVRVGEQD